MRTTALNAGNCRSADGPVQEMPKVARIPQRASRKRSLHESSTKMRRQQGDQTLKCGVGLGGGYELDPSMFLRAGGQNRMKSMRYREMGDAHLHDCITSACSSQQIRSVQLCSCSARLQFLVRLRRCRKVSSVPANGEDLPQPCSQKDETISTSAWGGGDFFWRR